MPGEIVGNVSIKVRPDTTKFSQELRAQLQKVNDDFEVDIGLNTKGALAEFKTLKQQIERDEINANVDLNTKGLGRAAGFRAPLAGVGKIFFQIQRSLDAAARSSRRMARHLVSIRQSTSAFAGQTLTWVAQMVRLATSVETTRRAWDRLSRSIQAVTRRTRDLSVLSRMLAGVLVTAGRFHGGRIAQFGKSLGQVRTYTVAAQKAMRGLRDATDRVAVGLYRIRSIRLRDVTTGLRNVAVRARDAGRSLFRSGKRGSAGIGRLMDSGIRGLGKMFSSAFSTAADAAGSFGKALARMSRGMLLFTAIAAIAAPLVGLIAGLLAGLPSLLAAAGAGFAAVALGWEGVKEAAQTLTPAIDSLKASLSETFKNGLTPVFDQLNRVMPTLEAGLNRVAEGLIPLAQSFTDVVTSARGMEQIESILANVGTFFQSLQPMVTTATQAFLTLSEAGANAFGYLSTVLNDFGASFNEMVNTITSSGAFNSAMEGLAQVLDSLLQGFVRLMEAGTVAMGQLGGPLTTAVNGIVDAFIGLMPVLTAASGLLFDVLGTALSVLAPAFEALGPPIQKLAELLGPVLTAALEALVPILTPLADFFGTVLTAAITALMPLVQPMVELFRQLGEILGGVLTEAATALTPLITLLGESLAEIMTALAPLVPALGELALAIIPPLVDVLLQLTPLFLELAQLILPLLVQTVEAAVPVLLQIAEAFRLILPPVIEFVGQVLNAVIPVFRQMFSVVQSVFPQIQGIISGAMTAIQGIIDLVLGIITGDWSRAWDGMKNILSGAWDAISNAVSGGIGFVVELVTTLPGKIVSALGDLGSLLWDAGKSLIRGFGNGISSMVSWVVGKARGVVSSVRNLFPFSPAKEGPFSGRGYTIHSGRALIADWARGVEDEAPNAIRSVEKMMGAANKTATADWNGQIQSDSFGITGSVFDGVMSAFDGSRLQVDGNGMAQLVNKTNKRNSRR